MLASCSFRHNSTSSSQGRPKMSSSPTTAKSSSHKRLHRRRGPSLERDCLAVTSLFSSLTTVPRSRLPNLSPSQSVCFSFPLLLFAWLALTLLLSLFSHHHLSRLYQRIRFPLILGCKFTYIIDNCLCILSILFASTRSPALIVISFQPFPLQSPGSLSWVFCIESRSHLHSHSAYSVLASGTLVVSIIFSLSCMCPSFHITILPD